MKVSKFIMDSLIIVGAVWTIVVILPFALVEECATKTKKRVKDFKTSRIKLLK